MNATQLVNLMSVLKVATDALLTLNPILPQARNFLEAISKSAAEFEKVLPQLARLGNTRADKEKKMFFFRLRELYVGELPRDIFPGVIRDEANNIVRVEEFELVYARTPLNLNAMGAPVSQKEIQEVMEQYQ